MKGKHEGRAITHASDSTTKKTVGQFIVQGLHIDQSCPLPIPILPIYGERAEDVAMQVDMGMEIMAVCKGMHDICGVVQGGGHAYGRQY